MLWLAAALFFAIRHKAKHWKKIGWIMDFGLLLLGVWALMLAPLPFGWGSISGLLSALVRWLFSFLGSWMNVAVPAIAGVALVIVLWYGLHDIIKDKKPDKWAKVMVVAVPVLGLLTGGALAVHLMNFVNVIGNVGPTVVSTVT